MSEDGKKIELRPFHETIVDFLNSIQGDTGLSFVAELLKSTKIPENHDAVIDAWVQYLCDIGRGGDEKNLKVIESLNTQKAEADKKAAEAQAKFEEVRAGR